MTLTIGLDPVLFRWGPLTLAWHGLLLTAGVLLGGWIFFRQAEAAGVRRDDMLELLLWAIVAGVAGARLLHVFLYSWQSYVDHPQRILAVHEGGLAWYGALIGGSVAVALVARARRLPFWRIADAAALAIAAGLIVGRIGCTIAGDVHGAATRGGWGLVYTHPGTVPTSLLGVPTFPAPILMAAGNAALLTGLAALQRRARQPGLPFLLYLIGYSALRFTLSFWQVERILLAGLHPTQVVAAATAIIACVVLACRALCAARRPGAVLSP